MLPLYLIIPFALVAAIWGALAFRRAGIIGGCLATLLFGSCFGYDFFHVSVITTDRLLLAAVVGIYFFNRQFGELKARGISISDVVLGLFVVCLLGSTFGSDWKWEGARPVALLLFFYLLPVAIYWVTSRCTITEQSHKRVLGFFVIFGVYLSLTGLLEVAGIHSLVFPRYIINSDTIEFFGRGRGPFLNPIGNGMYLTAGLIACLLSLPYVHKLHRPGMLGVAGLIGVGTLCTLTRSVWLGVAVAVVGLAVLVVPKAHRLRVILAASILGGVGIGLLGSNLVGFKRDKNVSTHEMQQSAKLRPLLAAFAYEMFKDRPLTGVGLSQYKRYNLEYLTKTDFDMPLAAAKTYVQHNIFLSLLVETGLIGVVLFILLLAVWFRDGFQLWYSHDAPLWQRQFGLFNVLMIGAYVPNGMFHEMSVIPMLNMLMFFVAGLNRNMLDQYMQEMQPYGRRDDDRRAQEHGNGRSTDVPQWGVVQERRQLPGA